MSVAPTCPVAEERDATDDEREDVHRGRAGRHGRAAQSRSGRHCPQPPRQRVEVLQLRDGSVEVHHERRVVTRFTGLCCGNVFKARRGAAELTVKQ